MNVLEDCIVFLIWTAWVLFNFYLKQKQSFPVWNFTRNVSIIFFHGGIWSRYSKINKFGLTTEVQHQNETEIKKLQTKVFDSMIFEIYCNKYF